MDTLIKIIIGIIIGAVGFWLLQPQGEEGVSVPEVKVDNEKVDSRNLSPVSMEADDVNKPELKKELEQKVLQKDKYLSPKNNPKGIVLGKKESRGPAVPPPEPSKVAGESQSKTSATKYLEGIPEDYHKLLDPPERRKDLPELHRDLVNEEQDLNWGLAMEQQIKSFVMNHPHSNYLLDFRVTCKTTMCEMMSKVQYEHTKKWSDLCNEMVKEGWWEFRGTSSSGTYTDDKKSYINIRHMTRAKKD